VAEMPVYRIPGSSQFRTEFAADSPLEGSGFELTVPQRSSSNRGPRLLRRFEEIANFLSNLRSNDS
jgi:hypothetical protein